MSTERSHADPSFNLSESRSSNQEDNREDAAWETFAKAAGDRAFCQSWLMLQCSHIPNVRKALLLLNDPERGTYAPAAQWPDNPFDASKLAQVAELALTRREQEIRYPAESAADLMENEGTHVGYPIVVDTRLVGAVAVEITNVLPEETTPILRQLLWGCASLVALVRGAGLVRATFASSVIQSAQEKTRLDEAAIVVVNQLTKQFNARVSLGVERNGRVELRAISNTGSFDRRTKNMGTIENAMEEAIEQASPVVYPPIAGAKPCINVAQRELASEGKAISVLSVPLVCAGRSVGALTFERNSGNPFGLETGLFCELLGGMLGPVIDAKLTSERWFAGRLVDILAEWRDKLFGPRHPIWKLAATAIVLIATVLIVVDGEFRVSAKTAIEGSIQRAAVAPFEGYIAQSFVRAGDNVREGEVLAVLDDRDLKLERARLQAELEQASGKYHEAVAKRDRAGSGVLAAQRNQVEAQLALVEEKLARSRLVAPFDGVVVSGDLSQMLGAPVEQGKVLFELAPLDAYRVIVKVDERDIRFVEVGQHGELALTGLTGNTIPFVVKNVTSVSTAQEGRNYFRVEAQLEEATARLRPGMEGVGKIGVGERRLIWIWTRYLIDWLRITFWTWMP